jgi:hypothetical protein
MVQKVGRFEFAGAKLEFLKNIGGSVQDFGIFWIYKFISELNNL